MTHIYFIRHAEPNYKNHDDLNRELTEKGLRDRELMTAFFTEKKVDVVLSSPYRRALDRCPRWYPVMGFRFRLFLISVNEK